MTRKQQQKERNLKSLIETLKKSVALLESMSIDNGNSVDLAKSKLSRAEAYYQIWKSQHAEGSR